MRHIESNLLWFLKFIIRQPNLKFFLCLNQIGTSNDSPWMGFHAQIKGGEKWVLRRKVHDLSKKIWWINSEESFCVKRLLKIILNFSTYHRCLDQCEMPRPMWDEHEILCGRARVEWISIWSLIINRDAHRSIPFIRKLLSFLSYIGS